MDASNLTREYISENNHSNEDMAKTLSKILSKNVSNKLDTDLPTIAFSIIGSNFRPSQTVATLKLKVKQLSNCADVLDQYTVVGKLGQGSQGIILALIDNKIRDNNDLRREVVVKMSKDIEGFEREDYFLRNLQDSIVQGHPIVVKYIDSWICRGKLEESNNNVWIITPSIYKYSYLVQERWSGDVQQLVKSHRSKALRIDHLWWLFRLCIGLGINGIISGDLKLNNFLYRIRADDSIQFSISDLGFAGWSYNPDISTNKPQFQPLIGWQSNIEAWKCIKAHQPIPWIDNIIDTTTEAKTEKKEPNKAEYYAASVNVMQLESYLIYFGTPIISMDGETQYLFAGIRGLNRYENKICQGYNQKSVDLNVSEQCVPKNAPSLLLEFDFKDLYTNIETNVPLNSIITVRPETKTKSIVSSSVINLLPSHYIPCKKLFSGYGYGKEYKKFNNIIQLEVGYKPTCFRDKFQRYLIKLFEKSQLYEWQRHNYFLKYVNDVNFFNAPKLIGWSECKSRLELFNGKWTLKSTPNIIYYSLQEEGIAINMKEWVDKKGFITLQQLIGMINISIKIGSLNIIIGGNGLTHFSFNPSSEENILITDFSTAGWSIRMFGKESYKAYSKNKTVDDDHKCHKLYRRVIPFFEELKDIILKSKESELVYAPVMNLLQLQEYIRNHRILIQIEDKRLLIFHGIKDIPFQKEFGKMLCIPFILPVIQPPDTLSLSWNDLNHPI